MEDPSKNRRIGVDIGGTFTDLVVFDDATGSFAVGKTLTTPRDPSQAVETLVLESLQREEAAIGSVQQLIHGTTLVTNAIIERKGSRTALLATLGFRDSIEIMRENRYELYDLLLEMPQPLVPRYLRFGVPQRTLADGTTLQELDTAFVEQLTRELVANGIEAVAIAFLNSFADPSAEREARAIIQRAAPGMRVSLSSEVVPEIREFERTSTTIANVYVQDRVEKYLRELQARLERIGFTGSLFLILSSGGIATVDTSMRFPVRLLESGPAGGALAAANYGASCGYDDLLSFDMGGTTAKFCIIDRGQPLIAHEFEVDRRYRLKKGSGLPIKLPVIEMIEIGAGGGSIARLDPMGLLKVGPDSAGAEPGPVCYGLGGSEPTVTDADLVLGYLDPGYFLGGKLRIDLAAARRVIKERIGDPLGLSIEEAAWGIHQIVNESMANAARIHTLERGKDPHRSPSTLCAPGPATSINWTGRRSTPCSARWKRKDRPCLSNPACRPKTFATGVWQISVMSARATRSRCHCPAASSVARARPRSSTRLKKPITVSTSGSARRCKLRLSTGASPHPAPRLKCACKQAGMSGPLCKQP